MKMIAVGTDSLVNPANIAWVERRGEGIALHLDVPDSEGYPHGKHTHVTIPVTDPTEANRIWQILSAG